MTEQQYRVIADRDKGDALATMLPGTVVYGGSTQPRTLFRTGSDWNGRHWIGEHGERYTDAEAAEVLGEFDSEPPVPTREQIAEAWDRAREDRSIPRERDGGMRPVDAFEAGFRSALAVLNGADR